ncbi:hypothetical protein FHS18_005878 [Paenibacillus phyllosphaerae]|uniref:Uncharacterized protein n=1 Tax=Paenibacillus phyllosphaerae TaxID=274593 RepID=A0A7W5B3I9_9BACL|nr:hypothetical protein [Paenibacillus phyllosphaerae]
MANKGKTEYLGFALICREAEGFHRVLRRHPNFIHLR